jgi:rubredoxin
MGEAERGDAAPRVAISYFCADGHETRPAFAHDAEIPDEWDCPKCGQPAGRNEQAPPVQAKTEPYKTHLAYVKERRNDKDGREILDEALAKLNGR